MNPRHLLWLDIETTGLHPEIYHILEISYVLTAFDYPYEKEAEGRSADTYLIDGPGIRSLLTGECGPRITEMHEASGLKRALSDSATRMTLADVEEDLLLLSETWPLEDKDARVQLAGYSVGFDLSFIRHHLPTFASRLSYRVFDASSHYRFCRSIGMPELPKSDPAHRAALDVAASIQLARSCAEWILERRDLPR